MWDAESKRLAAVEGLLRILADFSDKLARAQRDFVWWSWGVGLVASALVMAVVEDVRSGELPVWLFVAIIFAAAVAARLTSGRRITMVQLAAWRLRKVYEHASRLEDVGRALDPHQRLELELRLGEAQYLLNRLQWLGPPSSKAARSTLRHRPPNVNVDSEATPSPTSKDDDPQALPDFLDRPAS